MTAKRSFLAHLLFALLLVFAQQQAASHALDHEFERLHAATKDVSGHDDVVCAKCLVLAHLGDAPKSASTLVVAASYSPPRVASGSACDDSPTFVGAYQSRAPPVFS